MQIIDLSPDSQPLIEQVAAMLVAGFSETNETNESTTTWPGLDLDAALEEVQESLEPNRISRVAVDGAGNPLGWVGAIREYSGHTWQLHPLVVHPDQQGKGIGRALVLDLEQLVRGRGGTTIYLGTDDLDGRTSLSGVDLYPDIAAHIKGIQNLRRHPYEFYQKLGYVIYGILPDANGFGKPDILMAKRVGRIGPEDGK